MTHFVSWRSLAYRREGMAEGRAAGGRTTDPGQDKSACHERRKPLTRLGFSCAGWSVACMKHGFCEQFQWSGVPHAVPGIGSTAR